MVASRCWAEVEDPRKAQFIALLPKFLGYQREQGVGPTSALQERRESSSRLPKEFGVNFYKFGQT